MTTAANPPSKKGRARELAVLPVKLVYGVGGQTLAMPVHTNTSGDFAALTGTAGYVELAAEESNFPAGSGVRLQRW